ncbi:MAG: hypothetical protein E2585_23865 [Comamonas sp.]|uniref:IgG-binding virulence factor TspB family protein n=1 Tax=Comamonas sp. TaxID=34028 RepID=UPI0012D0F6DA|nr:IgG-binding virulence factor TspB family protein [Comamonas sp.]MPS91697.1 hypothetical protein [Comamonas sp.]
MTNAKFYRNLVCAGLGALALGYVPLSHAFYAQLTAPAGFTAGAINTYNAAKAGVTASVELGRIAATASLNVGGKAVGIATRIPYAGSAARAAAALIYLHPAVRTIATVATLLGALGYAYDVAKGWQKRDPDALPSDGYDYALATRPADYYGTKAQACQAMADTMTAPGYTNVKVAAVTPKCVITSYRPQHGINDTFTDSGYSSRQSSCPSNWYWTQAGCVQNPPMVAIPQTQFVDDLAADPKTPNILPELPFDLPVDVPYIEPIFVPTGNPVKNPKYDPSKPQTGENQPYVQPGVKVDPANDAKNPFQVNVQPSNRPTASQTGSTDAQPITPGSGTETDGSNDQPKEDKDERDLCEKNPDILACQKVDTEVEDAEIPKAQKTVTYQAENIWGGGSCPADQYARVGGQQLKVVDWSRDCQFITDYVRPVTLVVCALIVAGILAGALKP